MNLLIFFVHVGPNLAREIDERNDLDGLDERLIEMNPHSIFISAVIEQEILKTVHKLKNKKTTDNTNIDMMMIIKDIIYNIVTPLAYICNLSFQTGIFPNKMKTAKLIPIFKAGDKHQFTNHRPISLLSQFSKIIEKLHIANLKTKLSKTLAILYKMKYNIKSLLTLYNS